MIYVCGALFFLLLLWPVALALAIYRRKPGKALFISQDKVRNPRYFSESFRNMLEGALESGESMKDSVVLSRKERLLKSSEKLFGVETCNKLVLADERDFYIADGMVFEKEIYALGNVHFERDITLRSLYAKGSVYLGEGIHIVRWVDAEDGISVAADCDLGVSLTSPSFLSIGKNCRFRRLYAPEIGLGLERDKPLRRPSVELLLQAARKEEGAREERRLSRVSEADTENGRTADFSVISMETVTITEDMVVLGDVSSHKGVRLCAGAVVCGNVFAETDIVLEKGAMVLGNLFTQGSVYLEDGTQVGHAGGIHSVVAREHIATGKGCAAYGYLSCEKGGTVWEDGETAGAEIMEMPQATAASGKKGRGRTFLAAHRRAVGMVQGSAALLLLCLLCGAALYPAGRMEERQVFAEVQIDRAQLYDNQGMWIGIELAEEPERITETALYYRDRILQRFQADEEDIARETAVINGISRMIPGSVKQYLMLVPMRIELENGLEAYTEGMEEAMQEYGKALAGSIRMLDILPALRERREEYVSYRTLTGWTARGAYYGARAFGGETGFSLPELSQYDEAVYNGFYGGLWERDGADADNDDYEDRNVYYRLPEDKNRCLVVRRTKEGEWAAIQEPVVSKARPGQAGYVGNPISHAILPGSVENGKAILLIGDNNANLLAPYFQSCYEWVYVVNQTWYQGGSRGFGNIFEEYPVTDTLFVKGKENIGNIAFLQGLKLVTETS